jgi:7,8-dihydro-6-hydroxymethylpterin-pyrophosphokinase
MSQSTLLGLEARGTHAWSELGKALRVAESIGTISAVSSVIREAAFEHRPEILRAVVKIVTNREPDEIIIHIKTSSSITDDASSFGMLLLRYKNTFVMKPELTLPHPELTSERRWLVTASEVDPDWIHPVLHKPLEELARPIRFSNIYDFFAQGQTLLAFLSPKT